MTGNIKNSKMKDVYDQGTFIDKRKLLLPALLQRFFLLDFIVHYYPSNTFLMIKHESSYRNRLGRIISMNIITLFYNIKNKILIKI